jgi:hypothetical protein
MNGVVHVVAAQHDLFEFVVTLHPPRRFARRLDSRQKQSDENADDSNDYEKFNECESIFFHLCYP